MGIALDAFELRDGQPAGYRFQIIGSTEDDLLVLLGRLIEKIRRALSAKHLTDGEFGLQIADLRIVRGMIEWDDAQDGRVPLLVMDGREITWDEFGRMLMSFEGWQFKLNIGDSGADLETYVQPSLSCSSMEVPACITAATCRVVILVGE